MDQALIGKLHNLWPAAELASVTSDLEAKALVSGATVAISSRYHACICALSAGVPCLGTSWSHKYEALYDDYGVQDLLLAPDVAPVEVRRLVRNSMEPSAAIRPQLERRASEFRANTESLWRLVEDILKK
jgi:colanic acid/amylovoran biosynthesis protein